MVRFEEGNQREQLFEMWHGIFHDTIPYTEFYFREVYGKNEILLEEEGEELRGMLHLNPYTLQIGKDSIPAHYIVGVCTDERFRRQGVMRNLLGETFQLLRERKEPFTYLMPADEAYYLPFSFQFGMVQLEQEVGLEDYESVEAGYKVVRAQEEEYAIYADLENTWKKSHYAIATKISEEYLRRMSEEVRSEFGCFFFVKKEDRPIGRVVVSAQDDEMVLSQMVCYEDSLRSEFLQQILQFLDQRYHFRRYRILYAEDWRKDLLAPKQFGQLHIFETKEKPLIMFRILNLELLAPWVRAEKEVSCVLKVEDPQIEEQTGFYRFQGGREGFSIERVDGGQVDGTIDIASLTSRLFGNLRNISNPIPEGFEKNASEFWTSLISWNPIVISEIV